MTFWVIAALVVLLIGSAGFAAYQTWRTFDLEREADDYLEIAQSKNKAIHALERDKNKLRDSLTNATNLIAQKNKEIYELRESLEGPPPQPYPCRMDDC